jgi:hypothetical protein
MYLYLMMRKLYQSYKEIRIDFLWRMAGSARQVKKDIELQAPCRIILEQEEDGEGACVDFGGYNGHHPRAFFLQ